MKRYSFDPESLSYEYIDEPKFYKPTKIVLLSLALLCMVFLIFWLYLSVFKFDLPKTAILKRQSAVWESKINVLDHQLFIYEQTLEGLEQRDDDVYRSILGLNPIPDDIRNSGLEGVNRYKDFDELGANSKLKMTILKLDNITKRLYVQSRAFDELALMSKQAGDMISCVPSVPPFLPEIGKYRLTSRFGYRTDPVYGGSENHQGVDFAMDRGRPVYATGDAIVESVINQYRGYGNTIVLNHGYGYQTRYAHLHTTEVTPGMRVSRGDRIGTVGNTGKSTGPHLHYEVIYMKRNINPLNFMDINMPTEEYLAMIRKRQDESLLGKRSSSLELLKKGKK